MKSKNEIRFTVESEVANIIFELESELESHVQWLLSEFHSLDEVCTDVRLKVDFNPNGEIAEWQLKTGDDQYDQDHSGCWGSSSVWGEMEASDIRELAMGLCGQVIESWYEQNA